MSVFVPILGLYVTSQDDCILWGGVGRRVSAQRTRKKKREGLLSDKGPKKERGVETPTGVYVYLHVGWYKKEETDSEQRPARLSLLFIT